MQKATTFELINILKISLLVWKIYISLDTFRCLKISWHQFKLFVSLDLPHNI